MRSTPARMLHNGQLVVDRHSVSKITAEPFRLPHNTVSVELVNQLSGERSTRNLRWDEHVTTEEPLEVAIGKTGKATVELAQQRDEKNRPTYKYRVTDEAAGIDHEGTDLYLGAFQVTSNTKAARTVLADLEAAAEYLRSAHRRGVVTVVSHQVPQRPTPVPRKHRPTTKPALSYT
jgi:hypothetical protein